MTQRPMASGGTVASTARSEAATAAVSEPAIGADPRHVAIIMDGNGRWAKLRGLPRAEGHRRGVEAVRRVVRAAIELKIPFLTIYSFSSENWSRPAAEVDDLMGLMKRFIRQDLVDLHQNGVRLRVIGERDRVDPDLLHLFDEAVELTSTNTKLQLVVAFNYGARTEIARAAKRLAERARAGTLDPASITAELLSHELDTRDIPDPDLLIRTSGEVRLSNFLLWQAAYSELIFVDTFWPDFDRAELESAVATYRQRQRRFGGV
ncbi:MAG TPA: isoprenyl transferase [Hyphomicrobiaceae bacterium]|nr:isoprenyl transferase [Hyphomicrobiaceae bacterium]